MRDGAPRIGRPRRHNPMVDPQGPESEFVQISRPKEPVVDCIARGETAGRPSQKLPSTAIFEPQNRYARYNRLKLVIGH
jgi:hypothetical protein